MSGSVSVPASSMPKVLRRIFTFVWPHCGVLVAALVCLVLTMGCELAGPYLLGGAIDSLLAAAKPGGAPQPLSRDVVEYGVAFLAVGLSGQAFNFGKEILRTRLSTQVLSDIRVTLYDSMQRLCFRYHDANHSGDLITKATRDVYHIHTLYAETVFLGAEIVLLAGGAVVLIAVLDVRLALLAFSTFPFAAAIVVRAAGRMRLLSRAASDQYDAVTRVLQESISGVRVVKAFAREPAEIGKFERETSSYLDRTIDSIRYFTLNLPLAGALFNFSVPITLFGGAFLHATRGLGVGKIAAALFYLSKVSNVLRLLNRVVQTLHEAVSGGDRIFLILDAQPQVLPPREPVPMRGAGPAEVILEDVSFAYAGETPVLRGVSLRIEAGKRTAIMGPTGCGKSSLASLLPRFYDVTGGRVLLDGVDVRALPLPELRRAVSPIFQDTFLFSMTIAENIAYGRPEASREEIARCAAAAQIHDFIAGLEKEYDTVVGERGMSLSGGQKQRIAIARAFLMNPRVLIMDDCTASVDPETEKRLQQAMKELSIGRSTVVIAQRFSGCVDADKIVLLDQGRIVAEGTHLELLASCSLYAELYEKQVSVTLGGMLPPQRASLALVGGPALGAKEP